MDLRHVKEGENIPYLCLLADQSVIIFFFLRRKHDVVSITNEAY